MENSEKNTEIAKGLIAGSLLLTGLVSGSNPFFSLLLGTAGGVGSGVLTSLSERAFENWRKNWLSNRLALTDEIKETLNSAFDLTLHQLARDWKNHHYYRAFLLNDDHEKAKYSTDLILKMHSEIDVVFNMAKLAPILNLKSDWEKTIYSDTANQESTIAFLDSMIDDYFGEVESLARFAKGNFANNLLSHFFKIMQSDKGTPAWRAYQNLWQMSLSDSIKNVQNTLDSSQVDYDETKQELQKISELLSQFENQQNSQLTKTIQESLTQSLEPVFEGFKTKIDDLLTDKHLISELFADRFSKFDFDHIMTMFLSMELCGDENVNLEQAGHQTDTEIGLSQVFIDLPAADSITYDVLPEDYQDGKLPKGIINEFVETAEIPLDAKSLEVQFGESDSTHPSMQNTVYQIGRFVLIGGPGQGKTTTSQLVCQLFRMSILKSRPQYQLDPKVNRIIKELESLSSEEGIPIPRVSRFPIRIVLSDFAESLAAENDVNSLMTYIIERIYSKTNHKMSIVEMETCLRDYPWILVLDGLDEVPASSNRDVVLLAVENFYIKAASLMADLMVIATTRPQGYNDDFSPKRYAHKYLMPLSVARAEHYGKRLTNIRYKDNVDRRDKVFTRIKRALNEEVTKRLMQSPLQITIMTSLLGGVGTPPQERWSLFNEYYRVIYQRETERNIPSSAILRDYKPDIDAIHYQVGLLLQIESEYSHRTNAKLTLDRFSKIVENRLREEQHQGSDLEFLLKAIIEAAANRLVFIVGVESDQIGFEIRSLQEFMAAEALMQGGETDIELRLQAIATISHWRNVFLFAAGQCFANNQYLRGTIHTICAELNEFDDSNNRADAFSKIGSQLAIDILDEGITQNQPRFEKLFVRQALRLLDNLPHSNQYRLLNVYRTSMRTIYIEELEKRLQMSSPNWFATWALLGMSAQKNYPDFESLIDEYWDLIEEDKSLIYSLNTDNLYWILSKLDSKVLLWSDDAISKMDFKVRRGIPENFKVLNLIARNMGQQSEIVFPVGSTDNQVQQLHIISVLDKSIMGIPDNVDLSLDWMPLRVSKAFVINPSKETLALVLREISKLEIMFPSYLEGLLPWPISNLILFSQYSDDLESIANDVEKGLYGDLEQWLLAESRWEADGVELSELIPSFKNGRPFDVNIDKCGFPLSTRYSIRFKEDSDKRLSNVFREVLGFDIDNLELKNEILFFVASTMLRTIRHHKSVLEIMKTDEIVQVSQILLKENSYISELIIQELFDRLPSDEFIEIVSGFPEELFMIAGHRDEVRGKYCELLINAFEKDSTNLGVLSFLAKYICLAGKGIRVPQNLPNLSDALDSNILRSVIVFKIVESYNAKDESLDFALIEFIVELAKIDTWFSRSIFRLLTNLHKGSSDYELFLVELCNAFLDCEDYANAKIISEKIHDIVSERHSSLLTRWEQVNLPRGLDKLLVT